MLTVKAYTVLHNRLISKASIPNKIIFFRTHLRANIYDINTQQIAKLKVMAELNAASSFNPNFD